MNKNMHLRFLDPTQPAHQSGRLAVVDVGSSSLRLVIYDNVQTYPHLVLNQRVLSELGKGKGAGVFTLQEDRIEKTIEGLKWFVWTAEQAGAEAIVVTATSAVREATNGADFVQRAQDEIGLHINVIDGTDEARLAAFGARVSMPDAQGVVLDLGSGSYELCETHGLHRVESLPLGVFALSELSGNNPQKALEILRENLANLSWVSGLKGQDIIALGSGMRSLARMHMECEDYPLATLHDYQMDAASAIDFCQKVVAGEISPNRDLNQVWTEVLPYRAAALLALLEKSQAKRVRFTTFGLREGVLFTQLGDCPAIDDPLFAFVNDLASRSARGSYYAKGLASWVKRVLPEMDGRLLTVASCLAEVGWRVMQVYRADTAFRQVLGSGFVALGHKERVFLALVAFSRHEDKITQPVMDICSHFLSAEEINQARLLGGVLHLASVLDPSFSGDFSTFRLVLTVDGHAELTIDADANLPCVGDVVVKRLEKLEALL